MCAATRRALLGSPGRSGFAEGDARSSACLYAVARLRPVRLLVPLLLIVHVDRHELVVGLPLVDQLEVGSKR
jgi:hypothetical protein